MKLCQFLIAIRREPFFTQITKNYDKYERKLLRDILVITLFAISEILSARFMIFSSSRILFQLQVRPLILIDRCSLKH